MLLLEIASTPELMCVSYVIYTFRPWAVHFVALVRGFGFIGYECAVPLFILVLTYQFLTCVSYHKL